MKQIKLTSILKSITITSLMVMLFSCQNDINTIRSFSEDENVPVESSFDVNTIMTDSGVVKVRLKSPHIDYYEGEKDYMELPKGIHLLFYDSLNNPSSELKARYAINYVDERIMEAKHNVVASNSEGDTLYTEHLIWDQNTRKINTKEKVTIKTQGDVVRGKGMIADEDFLNWEILEPIGEFNIDQSE